MQIDRLCSCGSLVIEVWCLWIYWNLKIEFFNFSSTERVKELPLPSLHELNHFGETFTQGSNDNNNSLYEDQYLQKYGNIVQILAYVILNTQSMLSTFDEDRPMLNTYRFGIIGLSETWSGDDRNILKYVNIPR